MHYYQKNIGDYRRDTMHLSPLEHGVYNLFMDTYYLSEKPLCADHADLMRTHCLRSADEVSAGEIVLKDFFVLTDLGYIQKRCDIEIDSFHGKSKSASESANARWERVRCERIANALRTECEGNANHKPLTINQELITNNQDKSKDLAPSAIKKIPKPKTIAPLETLLALGVAEKAAADWLIVRKAKRAPLTGTALDELKLEAGKAGITVAQAVAICAKKSWQGFNAGWNWKDEAQGRKTPAPDNFATKDYGQGISDL